MLDRTTFYRRADGTPMSCSEKLAHLLELGQLTNEDAAALARCSPLTVRSYRKPSAGRPVPDRFLLPLELYVFDRIRALARSAGYTLRKAA
jgi:hypothetical protein